MDQHSASLVTYKYCRNAITGDCQEPQNYQEFLGISWHQFLMSSAWKQFDLQVTRMIKKGWWNICCDTFVHIHLVIEFCFGNYSAEFLFQTFNLPPTRKPYRIWPLFSHKNGDFGAIFIKGAKLRRSADLESGSYRHLSNRFLLFLPLFVT